LVDDQPCANVRTNRDQQDSNEKPTHNWTSIEKPRPEPIIAVYNGSHSQRGPVYS
jgi:hypothetical protein